MYNRKSYNIALVGNPNVGKSTIFNAVTGLNQHTGNWSGVTVGVCSGIFTYKEEVHNITDLPGSYSMFYESEEEKVTADYINSNKYDVVIMVVDANSLERNLCFCIQVLMKTQKMVLCINMIDIAEKNNIYIDSDELSLQLGIPVVEMPLKKKKGIDKLIRTSIDVAEGYIKTFENNEIKNLKVITDEIIKTENINSLCSEIVNQCTKRKKDIVIKRQSNIDRLLTSKIVGIPVMIAFLSVLFWLTAVGANYPSEGLSWLFSLMIDFIKSMLLHIGINDYVISFVCDGVIGTVCWVVSVMLPPALIFFPLFALLEDWGYLPRVAFNLDGAFEKVGTCGKQSLTMMMGFGCNACGVTGCRIISSEKERSIATVTNSFVPCNGKIPTLIVLSTMFFAGSYTEVKSSVFIALILVVIVLLSCVVTLIASKLLSLIRGKDKGIFILEMPTFKRPEFVKTTVVTIKEKVIHILLRAIAVSAPAGAIIWIFANVKISDSSILNELCELLDPIAGIIGMDGEILCGFILGFPANEIVLPIILMAYTNGSAPVECVVGTNLGTLLAENEWTAITALCTMILCVFHFPCATTCITIYKETKSKVLTLVSFFLPLLIGIFLCFVVNLVCKLLFI